MAKKTRAGDRNLNQKNAIVSPKYDLSSVCMIVLSGMVIFRYKKPETIF